VHYRSLNDGECSADWYNFQESVAHLQLLEEEVLESHKNLVDGMEHWMQQDISLLAMSNEVDYDQDGEFIFLPFSVMFSMKAFLFVEAKTQLSLTYRRKNLYFFNY
jgi:hypothetical protein